MFSKINFYFAKRLIYLLAQLLAKLSLFDRRTTHFQWIRGIILISTLFLSINQCIAAIDPYIFDSVPAQKTFEDLTRHLRCMVCQNQTLADSQAPFALDLRQEIYERIKAGEDKAHIKDIMVERYGEFILYEPLFKSSTLVLWLSPVLLLVIGFYMFFQSIKWK